MKRLVFAFFLTVFTNLAQAQWAVLDEEVRKLVDYINNVTGSTQKMDDLSAMSAIEAKFETLTATKPERFVGTEADCGDQKINLNHYNACMGLRNLRLVTLHERVEVLKVMVERDKQIRKVIEDGGNEKNSGALQRLQFELTGLQTRMQNDAMRLQVLEAGYKQREKMYETQMAEARRVTDTRKASLVKLGAVPFPSKLLQATD
jgi:hypothetical protein